MSESAVGYVEPASANKALRSDKQIRTIDGVTREVHDQYVLTANTLVPFSWDWLDLTYTGSDLTEVIYRKGGATGSIVATVALAYNGGGQLTGVGRT
jgi:hypothetical protein